MNKQEETFKPHQPRVEFTGAVLPVDEVEVVRSMLLHIFAKLTTTINSDSIDVNRAKSDVACKYKRRRILHLLELLEGDTSGAKGDDQIWIAIDGNRILHDDVDIVRTGLIIYARDCKNCEHQRIANRLRNRITLSLQSL